MNQNEANTQSRMIKWILLIVSLIMIAYHISSIWVTMFSPILHQNIHMGFSFVLLILVSLLQASGKGRFFLWLVLGVAVLITTYVHINYERLDMWAGYPEFVDIIIGIALVVLVISLTWKTWGPIFPTLVGIGILYALFGHHIKGALGHPYIEPKLVLCNLGIGLKGIYGMMMNASANLIFLFIIFGSVFECVGIDKFFLELGTYLGRYVRGGAAQTAIFSSSFVGMCTGAAAANVALTGSYTIPLMKKSGFRPDHAGAIEAVSSTGGQLTPPVMGVAIFLMASFLGVSYASLMARALIPAAFFYLIIILGVIVIATREKIPMLNEKIDRQKVINGAPLFVIPMGIVTILLINRFTPAYSAAVALGLLLLLSVLRKATRPSFKDLGMGFTRGAVMGGKIAIACGCIGMFTSMLISTGAGPKLAGIIQVLSGGHLVVALILTMILSIILGCAMPTPVAYLITALVVSPALVEMGLDKMTAHFFVFYFAILSAVTPPVAGATIVASQIAEYSYMKTGWESLKLTAPFFLVPFFIIKNPIIISKSQALPEAICAIISLVIACGTLLIFCQGFCFTNTRVFERILFLIAAFLATFYGLFSSQPAFVSSMILVTCLITNQILRTRKIK